MDDVDASDTFCDWMFHLQTSVHLQEVKLTLAVHQKLHRSCAEINALRRVIHSSKSKLYLTFGVMTSHNAQHSACITMETVQIVTLYHSQQNLTHRHAKTS